MKKGMCSEDMDNHCHVLHFGTINTWNYKLICKFHDFSMEIPVSSVATVSDVLTDMFMDIAGSLNFQDVEEKKLCDNINNMNSQKMFVAW